MTKKTGPSAICLGKLTKCTMYVYSMLFTSSSRWLTEPSSHSVCVFVDRTSLFPLQCVCTCTYTVCTTKIPPPHNNRPPRHRDTAPASDPCQKMLLVGSSSCIPSSDGKRRRMVLWWWWRWSAFWPPYWDFAWSPWASSIPVPGWSCWSASWKSASEKAFFWEHVRDSGEGKTSRGQGTRASWWSDRREKKKGRGRREENRSWKTTGKQREQRMMRHWKRKKKQKEKEKNGVSLKDDCSAAAGKRTPKRAKG